MRGLVSILVALALGATAPAGGRAQDPPAPPAFADWLAELRAEALTRGIRPEIVEQALGGLTEPLAVAIERDRTQAEVVLTLEEYIARQVTSERVRTGQQMLARHRMILDVVSAAYGVPPPIIVAIWGMESNFGRFVGTRPVIAALATLAWDPRRATLFRRELFSALEILNRGDIEFERLQGSWAGAMGQPQFMPSSYLQHAVDFDGDGRRDIWESEPDVFASIANYLKGYGWTEGYRWGREVQVPDAAAARIAESVERRAGTCQARRDMTIGQPLAAWQDLGIRLPGGAALPQVDVQAALVSGTKRRFLVYGNYEALLDYNCAHAYAISVGLLADQIGA
jgi:membrane-bound lytic murein transglycosylase B